MSENFEGGIELIFMCSDSNLQLYFGTIGGPIIRANIHRLEIPKYDFIGDLPEYGSLSCARSWIMQVLVTRSRGEISVGMAIELAMRFRWPIIILRRRRYRIGEEIRDHFALALIHEALDLFIGMDPKSMVSGSSGDPSFQSDTTSQG